MIESGFALAGLALGAWAARTHGVRFSDERVLWVAGGAVGAAASLGFGALAAPALGLAPGDGARWSAAVWLAGGIVAAAFGPALDGAPGRTAGAAAIALKLVRSPLASAVGVLVAAWAARGVPRLVPRHGAWFAAAGPGRAAFVLGAVVLVQRGVADAHGRVGDAIARHEAFHARNAACLGEWGFYLTYVTAGALRARVCHAPWNGLARDGRGNPFERTAWSLERDDPEPPRA